MFLLRKEAQDGMGGRSSYPFNRQLAGQTPNQALVTRWKVLNFALIEIIYTQKQQTNWDLPQGKLRQRGKQLFVHGFLNKRLASIC